MNPGTCVPIPQNLSGHALAVDPTQLITGARKARHIQRLPNTCPACSLGYLLPQNSPELHFQIISDNFYSSLTLTILKPTEFANTFVSTFTIEAS